MGYVKQFGQCLLVVACLPAQFSVRVEAEAQEFLEVQMYRYEILVLRMFDIVFGSNLAMFSVEMQARVSHQAVLLFHAQLVVECSRGESGRLSSARVLEN